jgi:hypothetical protein
VRGLSRGTTRAQVNLGLMYDAEAVRWYRLAAEQGLAGAQFFLGLSYDTGEGVPQDDVEAVRWYGRAAARVPAQGQPRCARRRGGRVQDEIAGTTGLIRESGRHHGARVRTPRAWVETRSPCGTESAERHRPSPSVSA